MNNVEYLNNVKYLDEFEVGSKILVTDPCYSKDTWCTQVLDVKPGIWEAEVVMTNCDSWGNRVSELLAWHRDYPTDSADESVSNDIGVDSGQCGFFDFDKYPDGQCGEYDDPATFYGAACKETLKEGVPAGVVNGFGVVSSSGYGDGCYNLYVGRDEHDVIVSTRLVFIEEAEDYDDEYRNEEDE